MSEFILKERPFIRQYHKFLRIAQPILALLCLLLVIFSPFTGLSVINIALIIALLLNTFNLFFHKEPEIVFDEHGIKVKDQTVLYQDLDGVSEVNNQLMFVSKGNKFLVLNEFRYEPDDLVAMNNFLEKHDAAVGDTREHFALEKIDNEKVSSKILIVISILSFIYLLALGQGKIKVDLVFVLLSLIIPLILFIYYSYLLFTNQINHVKSHRAGFLLAMLFPVILGWGVIYLHVSTGSLSPIVYTTVLLFVAFIFYYYFENHIRSQGNDYLYLTFVLIYIPLALVFGNISIPVNSVSYETHTLSSVNIESRTLGTFYSIKYVISYDPMTTVINAKEGKGKKVGDQVTVNVKKGFFNIYSDDEKVTIRKIKKISSGYRINYRIYHYRRILVSKKEAFSLKAHQKIKVKVRTGLFGVKDYQYVA